MIIDTNDPIAKAAIEALLEISQYDSSAVREGLDFYAEKLAKSRDSVTPDFEQAEEDIYDMIEHWSVMLGV